MLKWLTPTHGRAMSLKNEVAPIEIYYHVVNTSGVMKAAIPFIFNFMSAERRKVVRSSWLCVFLSGYFNIFAHQVHFHYSDMTSLHKFIAPEALPSEYGGTGAPIDYEEQQRTLLYENEGRLLEAMAYGLMDPEPAKWDNVCR